MRRPTRKPANPTPLTTCGPAITTSTNGKVRKVGKVRMLTREHLDGRSKARKQFDAIATGISRDLGHDLSTVQKHLVEAFAGCAIQVNALNAKLLLGLDVDVVEHSQVISTLVRVASRLGMRRVPRDVTPSVESYLAQRRHIDPEDFEEAEAAAE
jgi:hypothetical protein